MFHFCDAYMLPPFGPDLTTFRLANPNVLLLNITGSTGRIIHTTPWERKSIRFSKKISFIIFASLAAHKWLVKSGWGKERDRQKKNSPYPLTHPGRDGRIRLDIYWRLYEYEYERW